MLSSSNALKRKRNAPSPIDGAKNGEKGGPKTAKKQIFSTSPKMYRCEICRACYKSIPLIEKHCVGMVAQTF